MAKTISRVGIGSLTQLACRAPQDSIMYSDIDDETTSMFQTRHQQFTYFSSNDEILDFDDDVDFGKTISATLKYGEKFMCDMIGDIFLVLDVPELEQREVEGSTQNLTVNSVSDSLVFTPVADVQKIADTFPIMMNSTVNIPTPPPVPVQPQSTPPQPTKQEVVIEQTPTPSPTIVIKNPEVLPTPTSVPIQTPEPTVSEPVDSLVNLKYRVETENNIEPSHSLVSLKYKVKEFETEDTISLKYKTTPINIPTPTPTVKTIAPTPAPPVKTLTPTPTPTPPVKTLTPTPTPDISLPKVVTSEIPTITPNPSLESMATPIPMKQEPVQTFIGMSYTGVPFTSSSSVSKQYSSLAVSTIGTISMPTAYQPVAHHVQEPVTEAVTGTATQNVYYNNNIGLSLVESISVRSDNQVLCEFSGESLDLHNKLNVTKGKLNCMKEMYGIYDTRTSLVQNGKSSKQLYINIPLFWNKTFRQFFPLVAMGNSKLEFKVKLRKLSEIANVDGTEDKVFTKIINNCIHFYVGEGDKVNALGELKAHIMVQSFILSPMEKDLFLHNTNTFLYKRIYTNTFDVKHRSQRISLNFLHPTEWLAICYKPSTTDMFEYERIESLRLIFDGIERHRTSMHPEFYRLLQKHNYFENNENDNIYVYSFCLKAGHGQNSGSINFSKVLNKELEVILKKADSYSGTLHVFASSYNFLECDGSSGKLLFY